MSNLASLWEKEGEYYISFDFKQVIPEPTGQEYMLLYKRPPPVYSEYRDTLYESQKLTLFELYTKSVLYRGTQWTFKMDKEY